MKSKFDDIWQESPAITDASLKSLMAIKQGIIEKIGCPAETTQINLIRASELQFAGVSGEDLSISVIHFADAKNRRFVCMFNPMELQALRDFCEAALKGLDLASTPN